MLDRIVFYNYYIAPVYSVRALTYTSDRKITFSGDCLGPREDCNSMNKCLLFLFYFEFRTVLPNSKLFQGSIQRRAIQ